MSEPAQHTRKAPAHDPFCRQQHWEGGNCFDCHLIADVRADERVGMGPLWRGGVAEVEAETRAQVLDDLRARVEEVTHAPACPGGQGCWCPVSSVVALLRSYR